MYVCMCVCLCEYLLENMRLWENERWEKQFVYTYICFFICVCFNVCVCVCVCVCVVLRRAYVCKYFTHKVYSVCMYLSLPLHVQDVTQARFRWFEFSFLSPRLVVILRHAKPSLSYYLPITGVRIVGFIVFSRVLARCEMQRASSEIWIQVAVSIPNVDNHDTAVSWRP